MLKMYEPVLEKMEETVYNIPEWRVHRIKQYLYRFPREICKETKKEVFLV